MCLILLRGCLFSCKYTENIVELYLIYSQVQRGKVPLNSSLRRFPIIWVTLHRWQHRCLLGNEYGGLHGHEFLGRTLMILILTIQAVFVTFSVVKILPLAQSSLF